MISKEKLEEYKEIYRSEYGKEILDQDALTELTALVTFVGAVERHQNTTGKIGPKMLK
jgi:hypothetical protein